ncbi:hypothetical protein ThimaDRAFT_0374 [Thiocapsa marina 5811]|uniref:Uncharacterized protein n=1 Tax=Thiocapsa marina 5811 TaxID=768671 RepID=F9U623_9GAMM|nr:hypothetical protein ThimaDRAFT_0374 [Thiocapsa marina 5811]
MRRIPPDRGPGVRVLTRTATQGTARGRVDARVDELVASRSENEAHRTRRDATVIQRLQTLRHAAKTPTRPVGTRHLHNERTTLPGSTAHGIVGAVRTRAFRDRPAFRPALSGA